jgi:hypothetical protein
MSDPLGQFINGPPWDWRPKAGEAVYLLLGQTVVSGAVQGIGEQTHWSGNVERWYSILLSGRSGKTIVCSRNSIRPRK